MVKFSLMIGDIVLVGDKDKAYINCDRSGEIEPNGVLF